MTSTMPAPPNSMEAQTDNLALKSLLEASERLSKEVRIVVWWLYINFVLLMIATILLWPPMNQ